MRTLRLVSSTFRVDVRLIQVDGRWVASADTPDGPTLGLAWFPLDAVEDALAPFEGNIDELLDTVPDELYLR